MSTMIEENSETYNDDDFQGFWNIFFVFQVDGICRLPWRVVAQIQANWLLRFRVHKRFAETFRVVDH